MSVFNRSKMSFGGKMVGLKRVRDVSEVWFVESVPGKASQLCSWLNQSLARKLNLLSLFLIFFTNAAGP